LENTVCNLCGSDACAPYGKTENFQVVRCGACGLFYTNPRRTPSQTTELYSEDYFASDDPSRLGYDDYSLHAEGLRRVFADNLAIIERYFPAPGTVLDVGCAFGYFIETAVSKGWGAEGVEISAFASEVARKRTGASVHTGTLAHAALGAASFDAVTMWDMLEHSLDPSAELSEVNRILKPGGCLFLTIPDAGSRMARLMGSHWYGFKSAGEHNYFFSAETIERMLAKAGFALVERRPGVWPCSMRFLASKLAPYSKTAAGLVGRLVSGLGIEDKTVMFRFIDMFVVARKERAS